MIPPDAVPAASKDAAQVARCNECGTWRDVTQAELDARTVNPCRCGSGAYMLGQAGSAWTAFHASTAAPVASDTELEQSSNDPAGVP